jgi:hypothetical protein
MPSDIVFSEATSFGSPVVEIHIGTTVIGYFQCTIDAGWVFYNGDRPKGFWSQRVLFAIANKIKELNDKLFGEGWDEPKSEVIQPAIRKLDLDD